MGKKTSLLAPWEAYRNMLVGFFEFDDEIIVDKVTDENGTKHISINVTSHNKYEALDKILAKKIIYGNVTIVIDLYDEENYGDTSIDFSTVTAALDGNMMVYDFVTVKDDAGTDHNYVVFGNNDLVQFYNNNLSDYHGNTTLLPEDIAKMIFNVPWNIQFCTQDLNSNHK